MKALIIVLVSLQAVYAQETAATLALKAQRLFDAESGTIWRDRVLVISGEKILAVKAANEQLPADAKLIDLGDATLLPGLIDAHSHLFLHPYNETPWNDQVLKESLSLRTVRAVVHAEKTLLAGFTALRDLGTEGADYADLGIREAINQGLIPGPRLAVATRGIVISGGYGPTGFDPRWEVPQGAEVADGVEGVRQAVRRQIGHGADWIKVYADYRHGGVVAPTFTLEELRAAVEEAAATGHPVVAHATTPEGIRRAVLAGVKSIEHGSEADDEAMQLMAKHAVALCPTLAAREAIAGYAPLQERETQQRRLAAQKEMFKRAMKFGVPIVCGSDVGVFAHGDNAWEIELLVEYGMLPAQALQAATIHAARLLRWDDRLGSLTAGMLADVIATKGDPLIDIKRLREVIFVMKGGEVYLNEARR
jgi:imidazolonepropionase-like amidohydrolase